MAMLSKEQHGIDVKGSALAYVKQSRVHLFIFFV